MTQKSLPQNMGGDALFMFIGNKGEEREEKLWLPF